MQDMFSRGEFAQSSIIAATTAGEPVAYGHAHAGDSVGLRCPSEVLGKLRVAVHDELPDPAPSLLVSIKPVNDERVPAPQIASCARAGASDVESTLPLLI